MHQVIKKYTNQSVHDIISFCAMMFHKSWFRHVFFLGLITRYGQIERKG